MVKANVYVLGGKVELDFTTYDVHGVAFIPLYARMSIKEPDGTIITISGGQGISSGDLITASGYMYYLYTPPTIGWTEYELWAADGTGREGTDTRGFDVIDHVY